MTPDNQFENRFQTLGKCLVLRLNRLRHLPPALYATQMMHENAIPILVAEFGKVSENRAIVDEPVPTIRLSNRWAKFFLNLKPMAIFLGSFLQLSFRFLREGRPKLLVAHGMQEQCLAHLLSILFRIDIMVHVHEIYAPQELDRFNRFFFSWGLLALKRAKLLLYPESNRAKVYQKAYRVRSSSQIVFNSPRILSHFEKIDLRRKLSLPSNAVLMGYLGGIGKFQGFEQTFLAMVEVPEVHFLIWGWGEKHYLQSLKAKAKSYRIESRVHFLGETLETKWSYLASCDFAYCLYVPELLRLQHAATASNKLMESMSVGIPVLTSDNEDFREMVIQLDIGLCANPKSSTSIARALQVLATDISRRQRWGANARAAHLSTYNFEHQFEKTLQTVKGFFNIPINKSLSEIPAKAS